MAQEVAVVWLALPRGLRERLREESRRLGVSEEELAVDILAERLGRPLDPPSRAAVHAALCRKFLREARELLARGDHVQASEKAWGAAAHALKAVAAAEGLELRSHGELWRYAVELARRRGDDEMRRLWNSANALHQNFYENWMPPEAVEANVRDVEMLVERLGIPQQA